MSNERYELRRMPLARGVMGEVWQGRDRVTGRDVAVKFPRASPGVDRAELARWFRHEARITASLRHPGLPAIYAVGVEAARPYLVMGYLPGSSVSDVLAAHGRLPAARAAAIAVQACSVLAAVHDAGLVHRDVEPANLMLRPDGRATLIDFGLAVSAGTRGEWPVGVSGTPTYVAPEEALGSASGPRGDLYALGRTLHEMLTGRRPESGRDNAPRDVPQALAATLRDLQAPDPADRPASAREVGAALLPLVAEGTGASGVPPRLPAAA